MQQKILIVDSNHQSVEILREALKRQDYEVIAAYSRLEAESRLLDKVFHLVLADEKFVAEKGQNFLDFLYQKFPGLPVLLLHSQGLPLVWEEVAQKYGHHWVSRSRKTPELLQIIEDLLKEKEHDQLKDALVPNIEILGNSPAMKQLRLTLETVANTNATVLLRGETGTGKELAARYLHLHSPRKRSRFVAVNCAALTESLLESELFGHEKGAFTGANRQKLGKFEYAGNGTLFLDEIGEISPHLQAKLLRVLDEREFERVGGNKTLGVQCRIIAASNIDFAEAMREKRFRVDLYYRLNVVSIDLPPLREHREDIPLLARHFLKNKSTEHRKKVLHISPTALDQLIQHPWPGNVRELENIVEQAVILSGEDGIDKFPLPQSEPKGIPETIFQPQDTKNLVQLTLKEFLTEILTESEALYFDRLLNHHLGHISKTAASAGIDRKTFYRKIQRCGIDPKTYKKKSKK